MGKIKNALAALLTLTILILAGLLPTAVSYYQDKKHRDTVHYKDVEVLELAVGGKLSFTEKLWLTQNSNAMEVSEVLLETKAEDLPEAAWEALQYLKDNPFMPKGLKYSYLETTPMVVWEAGEGERKFFLWRVYMELYGDDGRGSLSIYIDDETGKPLAVDLSSGNYHEVDARQVAESLCRQYCDALGLHVVDRKEEIRETVEYTGELLGKFRYQCVDTKDGEVHFEIGVSNLHFYLTPTENEKDAK